MNPHHVNLSNFSTPAIKTKKNDEHKHFDIKRKCEIRKRDYIKRKSIKVTRDKKNKPMRWFWEN